MHCLFILFESLSSMLFCFRLTSFSLKNEKPQLRWLRTSHTASSIVRCMLSGFFVCYRETWSKKISNETIKNITEITKIRLKRSKKGNKERHLLISDVIPLFPSCEFSFCFELKKR